MLCYAKRLGKYRQNHGRPGTSGRIHCQVPFIGIEMNLPALVGSRRGILFALVTACAFLSWQCSQDPAVQSTGRGAAVTAFASSVQAGFKIADLNDGTPAAWGSRDRKSVV